MKTHQFRFGEITILKSNLAEVVISEGIVMDLEMVEEYHKFLLNNLIAPFSLLVNKKFSYTYTFEAQRAIANLEAINAMAIVNHHYTSAMATEVLINMNRDNNWNIKLFKQRDEALEWLGKQD